MTLTDADVKDLTITDKEIAEWTSQKSDTESLQIKRPSEYMDEVESYFSDDLTGGIPLPFEKTIDDFKVRMGEVSLVTGYSGHGKSAWLNYVMLHLLKHNKSMIASFEMKPRVTLGRMCQQTGEANPNTVYIRDFLNKLEHHLYLYDPDGETTSQKVLDVIYYCAEKLNIKIIVLDSLMKCGINEDDLNKQKSFTNKLCVAARDLNIHIFLVAHSRKTPDENINSSKFDIAGSLNISNMVDNVLSVHRNKRREQEKRKDQPWDDEIINQWPSSVHLLKQRHGNGIETYWGFGYIRNTFQYTEDKNDD